MKLVLLIIIILCLACSGSIELGKIDYTNDDMTVADVMKHEKTLLKEKRYSDLRKAYDWIRAKSPSYFEENLKLNYIDLYGSEGRYERQILEYAKIFPNDSVNAIDKIINFYYQMGKSYENRAKIVVNNNLDSVMIKKAIGYYKKCFTFDLDEDIETQSAAEYYAALNSAKIWHYKEARRLYKLLLGNEKYENLEYHKRAFFKIENVQDSFDIELSDAMEHLYAARYVRKMQSKDSLAQKVNEMINSSGMIVSDSLRNKN